MDNIKTVKDNSLNKIDSNNTLCSFFVLLFTVLLFLRDVGGFNINKFLFVIILLVAVLTLRLEKIIYLFCFLNPLCVGLPSKYMIIVFILPFILNHNKLKLQPEMLLCTCLAVVCLFVHNTFRSAINTESMIFPIELVFILLLFSYKGDVSTKRMAIFFILGVAVLGVIMLLSELKYFSFAELMTAGNRLGVKKDKYFGSVEMRVSVDPNYYGMFAITALVLGSMAIKNAKPRPFEKTIIVAAVGTSILIAFIGLSRSFVLVAMIYTVLFLLKQKMLKSIFAVCMAAMGALLLMLAFFPDVVYTLLERFTQEGSLQGANGREDLISLHFNAWSSGFIAMLFGTGLMECNVHCMPLQYLFGGGITLFIVMALFFLSLYQPEKSTSKKKSDILIAMFPILLMSCTIPIATSLTQLFTIVIVIYCSNKRMI